MMEFHITISTPDLADALRTIADAISTASVKAEKAPRTRSKKAPAEAAAPVVIPPAPPAPVVETPSEAPTTPVAPVANTTAPAAQLAFQPAATVPETPAVNAVNPVTGAPVTPGTIETERTYTMDDLANAGAALLDRGLMDELMAVLGKFGVQIITQIPPAQYAALAAELRALGASI